MASDSTNLPLWRQYIESALAAASNPHTAKYMQLASVDAQLGAQVRTVVYRGFAPFNQQPEPCLWVATDSGSDKIAQFQANSKAQIAWYFVDTREQFRLSGEVELTGVEQSNQHGRLALWQSMSNSAREAFFTIVGKETDPIDRNPEPLTLSQPPDNFVLLSLQVQEVDHLQIAQLPHQRTRFWYEHDHWHSQVLKA